MATKDSTTITIISQEIRNIIETTVASCTSSEAHDLNFGMGLLNWVEQICLQ